MEFVLNHSLGMSDTPGPPDTGGRRTRPQSAFVPSTSYYAQKEDDVGRPVRQHKPLAKGEFTQLSLAKVFDDDPGMRPKCTVPANVNKPQYGLQSRDVEGAAPRPKDLPKKPRETDPNSPAYILPGSSAASTSASTSASAAPDHGWPGEPSGRPPPAPRTAVLDVSDINAVPSVVERAHRMATRSAGLNTDDIEGSWPGWEPPFRAHVGRNLRDPGLNVQDISGTHVRRRATSARPTMGRDGWGETTSSNIGAWQQQQQQQQQAREVNQPPQHIPREPLAADASPSHQQPHQQQRQQQHTYMPAPMSWLPAQQPLQHQQPEPAPFESPYAQPPMDQQQGYGPPVAAPVQPPPLHPAMSGAPYATHIPGGGLAAMLSSKLGSMVADRTTAAAAVATVAAADLPSATIGRSAPARGDPATRHAAKRAASDAQRTAAAEAQQVISQLRPSREAVESFWETCRRMDRETCGKLSPADFSHALERAGVVGRSVGGAGSDPTAAALARGLQDGCGMVSYRQLARALVGQAPPSRSASLSAGGRSVSLSGGGMGGGNGGAAVVPTRGSSSQPPSRQVSGGRSGAAGGGMALGAVGSTSASGRRSVNWAPAVEASGSPAPSYCSQQPQQPQQQQLQSGPTTMTARFYLGGGQPPSQEPPLAASHTSAPHDWLQPSPSSSSSPPPPAAAPAPAAPNTYYSSSTALPGVGAGPNWPPVQPADSLQKRPAATIGAASGTPSREACETTYHPYKAHSYWFTGKDARATDTADTAAAVGVEARAEAARDYVPSADITASIVGKGHNRTTIPGTGVMLDAAVEAAIVNRHLQRPFSATSASAGRGGINAASLRQMAAEGPPLYGSGDADPGVGLGASLKGPGASLFGSTRTAASGPRMTQHSHGRPASAPRAAAGAGGAGAGGGGARVGPVARERQLLREDIAAVRGLY